MHDSERSTVRRRNEFECNHKPQTTERRRLGVRTPRGALTMSLEEVSTEALMAEITRRLECQSKPEKRLILVGPPGCGKVRRASERWSPPSRGFRSIHRADVDARFDPFAGNAIAED